MTVLELIERCSARLEEAGVSFGHGTTNAFDEAAWLVLWRLGLPLDDAGRAWPSASCRADEQAAVEALVDERIASAPAGRLPDRRGLAAGRALLRRRTRHRAALADRRAAGRRHARRLAGRARRGACSTCAPATAAWPCWPRWPGPSVSGATPPTCRADALAVARHQRRPPRPGRPHHAAPGRRPGRGATGRYDLILCNPPYVNRASMAALPAEYRAEPRWRWRCAGGDDGMDFVRRAARRRAGAPEAAAACWCSRSATSAPHFEAAFPRLQPVWLPTSAGDDQVLLLEPGALAMITLRNITLRRGAKVVLQGANVDAAARARRSASSAATAPASRACSRCSPARLHADAGDVEIPPRWRIGEVAQDDARDRRRRHRLRAAGRPAAAARAGRAGRRRSRGRRPRHRRRAPGARRGRRLRRRARAPGAAAGPGLPRRPARRAGQQLLRRLAHAAAAGARADVPGRPAAARRADQPPGPGRAGLARGLAQALRRHDDRDQPRPRVPRRDHARHRAPGRGAADALHRQLQRLRGDARRAA